MLFLFLFIRAYFIWTQTRCLGLRIDLDHYFTTPGCRLCFTNTELVFSVLLTYTPYRCPQLPNSWLHTFGLRWSRAYTTLTLSLGVLSTDAEASIEGIQCGARDGLVGNVLWGSGGVGWMSAGSARAIRGSASQRADISSSADALRRSRRHAATADGERHPPDDARCRRKPPPSRPPLPAPPSASPRWAAAAPSSLLSFSVCLCPSVASCTARFTLAS